MRADQPDEPDQPQPDEPGEPGPDEQRPDEPAPATRAEQLAAHLEYRETVTQASPAAADRGAWREAVSELRATWAQHKERYPERPQALPRTEADGSWTCGEHRRLDPEQNAEAGKAHADLADEASSRILPALRRVEAADPDRRLAGLEHMVKGEDRLKEKLAEQLVGKDTTIRQALGEVPDGVRFTLSYDSQSYSEGVLADVERLKAEGFALIKLKNLWTGSQYKGVNSQWRNPESDLRFELQFHTPESLAAKELTHPAYERIRSSDATAAERREARSFQRHVNALLPTPPGVEQIKDYPERKDG